MVINRLRTRDERKAFENWLDVRDEALESPRKAQRTLDKVGDKVKIPIFVQGGIHGNEYEGVDAAIDVIERFATARPGTDPAVDRVLRHAILIFNPIQNPDGRVAGTRRNGNGFDLNRDYLTQSQSETRASIELMKRWLPPEVLDLHGYVSPTLIEATTKPHNPSIEYDLWLKWNQPRIDANEAAVNAIGRSVTRPINDWCADGSIPAPGALCPDGRPPGPAVAESWDDWGPFYTAMYAQHLGLDSSTVEMCDPDLNDDGSPVDPECGGRAGSRDVQIAVQTSTFDFVTQNRVGMLRDELEIYRRGDEDAPRPACCPPPFDVDNNWMLDYPKAYVIPVGSGQRSDAEANRLVEWLLFNDIEVTELTRDQRFGDRTFERGSYVAWIAQPRRGLLDTAMSLGVDISERIGILYAPPAAWSHGYLWGADVVTIPDGAAFAPYTKRIFKPNRLDGGVERGWPATAYTLEIDSPAAVRAANELIRGGVETWVATEPFSAGPAGTLLFSGGHGVERRLDDVGRARGLEFGQAARRTAGARACRAGAALPGPLQPQQLRRPDRLLAAGAAGLRGRPGHRRRARHRGGRSARRLRRPVQLGRRLSAGHQRRGQEPPLGLLRRGRRLHQRAGRRCQLPHRRRAGHGPRGGQRERRRKRLQRHRAVGQPGRARQRRDRRLPGPGHDDRRPADVADVAGADDDGRRKVRDHELLPVRSLPARGPRRARPARR